MLKSNRHMVSSVALALVFLTNMACAEVTLKPTTVQWRTYAYELNEDLSIKKGSFDGKTIVTRTYDGLEMENEYLRVTLVPAFGGRVVSMFYKPTGHEELYWNPVGVPYGIDKGGFYYKWLMLWGGIFPTLPESEHAKSWCVPWEHKIIENTPQRAAVAMTWTDDVDLPNRGAHFQYGKTNITCVFTVSLKAGSTVLTCDVKLINPNTRPTLFEYWTNTGLAPGSEPGETRCTAGAEMIVPGPYCKLPWYSSRLWEVDKKIRGRYKYFFHFEKLKWFKNHVDMGVIYPWPEVIGNFWGVINHDNGEGIFRIADNRITPGLKIWTFGYKKSVEIDPEKDAGYHRPFLELWAGVSREFFVPAVFDPQSEMAWPEYYTPTVGLDSVTQASKDMLINAVPQRKGDELVVTCQCFATAPGKKVTLTLRGDNKKADRIDTAKHQATFTPDPKKGNVVTLTISSAKDHLDPDRPMIHLRAVDEDGRVLLNASQAVPAEMAK